jgi:hypothetical protein
VAKDASVSKVWARADCRKYCKSTGVIKSKRLDRLRLPLPAPAVTREAEDDWGR